jgi:hypothetical protein
MEVFPQAYWGSSTPTTAVVPAGDLVARSAAEGAKVVAFISLYRNGNKVVEGEPVQAMALADNRLGVVPIDLTLPLEGIEAGEYQRQVTVLDRSKDRAAFWQLPPQLRGGCLR